MRQCSATAARRTPRSSKAKCRRIGVLPSAQKDVDARWTKKHGKSYYGYKLHVNVDRRNGLIRKYELSPANAHDSGHFETLLDQANTRKRVCADSAYASESREAALKAQGIKADICHKGTRGHPLSAVQQCRNHRIAKEPVAKLP